MKDMVGQGVQKIWIKVLLVIPLLHYCRAITFTIERQLNMPDIIPNDIGISSDGRWIKIPCRSSCNTFNAQSPVSGCRCRCTHSHSTFQMKSSATGSVCFPNSDVRASSRCTIQLRGEGSFQDKLPVIDTANDGEQYINPPNDVKEPRCSLNGKPSMWNLGNWIPIAEKDFFGFTSPNSWTNKLTWKSSSKYIGHIMRVPVRCQGKKYGQDGCTVLKIKGSITYNFTYPTPTSPTSTPPTTKSTPTHTSASTGSTQKSVPTHTSPKTVKTQYTPTKHTTPVTDATSTSRESTTEMTRPFYSTPFTKPSSTEEPVTSEKVYPTDTDETSTIITTTAGGVPGGKDAREGDKGATYTITVAAIAAAAVILCVAIVSILIYCLVKQRQKERGDTAYSADMTVIMNSTGQNNNSLSTGVKLPIQYDDAVYCEPAEQRSTYHKRGLPGLGNPNYERALKPGSGRHGKNINTERRGSNIYDNRDNEPARNEKDSCYDNAACDVYDDIDVMKRKQAEELYESLPGEGGVADSVYQPLVREEKQEAPEAPKYLPLAGERGEPSAQIPEYLALIADNASDSNENQAHKPREGSLTYDYADPAKTLNKLPEVSKEPTTEGGTETPPLYHLFEQQTNKGEDTGGSDELPVYAVLEDEGHFRKKESVEADDLSLYDDVKEMQGQEKIRDNMQEGSSDPGVRVPEPPVYDVLEDPDTDYLMPVA